MHHAFQAIVETFLANEIGICDFFVSPEMALGLRANLNALKEKNQLNAASIGSNHQLALNTSFRNDKILWLDRIHENKVETEFLDIIDAFILFLNTTCYTGIKSSEFHYALYDTGSFYKKHLDQFNQNTSRQFSMILYLNENWQINDGGELCIYKQEIKQLIEPTNCKLVFFKSSDLLHEVLVTNKPRLSVTGWLKL